MKIGVLIILSSLVLFYCRKDKLKDDEAFLAGTWNWKYTTYNSFCDGTEVDDYFDPLTESKNYSIVFEKKGEVHFFEDENLVQSHFIVFDSFSLNDTTYTFVILLDNDENARMSGSGSITKMNFGRFPYYSSKYWCDDYDNYFVKE